MPPKTCATRSTASKTAPTIPMVRKRLTELLDELHAQLEDTDQISADTRERLQTVSADVRELLARETEDGEDQSTLRDRLLSLEVEHPRLAAIIGETAELISRLGV